MDGLERAAVALGARGHARDLIIHQGGDVILEDVGPLINHRLGCIRLNAGHQIGVVRLDNLRQLVRQVILGALVVVLNDGRADLRRGNGENSANHPVGTAPKAAEAHEIHVLVQNAAEEAENELHFQGLTLLLWAVVFADIVQVIPLRHDTRNALAHIARRLPGAATVLCLIAAPLHFLGRRKHLAPPRLPLALEQMFAKLLVNEKLRATDTDTRQNVLDEGEELDVIHGAGEAEMAEMAGTFVICLATAAALPAIV